LNKLLSYLTSPVMQTVKVVYLHVLATSTPAIKFYEKHSFVQHLYLPFYYHIAGKHISDDILAAFLLAMFYNRSYLLSVFRSFSCKTG